jgi:transketolase C-terminal domain/subunit
MDTMRIKFVNTKGSCIIGYVGDYPIEQAQSLIKEGVAVEVVEEQEIKPTKKEVTNV